MGKKEARKMYLDGSIDLFCKIIHSTHICVHRPHTVNRFNFWGVTLEKGDGPKTGLEL